MTSTMLTTDRSPVPAVPAGRRPGLLTVLRWELRKLAAQARTRYTLLACAVAPVVLVLILSSQQKAPKDSLYGRYVHASGWALPLLILGFAAQYLFPLLTAIVAGDIFSSEDQHGTWKTVLTRSVSRSQMFWGKTLAAMDFAVLTLTVLGTSTIASAALIVGRQDLIGLSGQTIPGSHALGLVVASWATAYAPLLGFTALAILLSVRSRNSSVGVVAPFVLGFVMNLVGTLGGTDLLRRFLLTTPFESWHELLVEHPFHGPLVEGLITSAAWTALCLTAAYALLRRRDITGG